MKNHNDKAIETYFSSMLNDAEEESRISETLVEDVPSQLESLPVVTPIQTETIVFSEEKVVIESEEQLVEPLVQQSQQVEEWKNLEVENEFQVLFFQLSSLTFAVPLVDLGGIHHLDESLNELIGKPDWFSGVMSRGDMLYNIVDTAKWIGIGETSQTLNYSHYVILGETKWGLSCEKLLGTETITYAEVEWRKVSGKRPWLAGMIKDKMCVLIHAHELIKLLNNGMNIHGH
jgi:purine-binding chemotaxis protein CheW